jgi:hypothetical protein
VFGTADYGPLAYAQWTRYLGMRPAVVALPAGAAVATAAVVCAAAGTSVGVMALAMLIAGGVGFVIGGALWIRREDHVQAERRQLDEIRASMRDTSRS